MRKAIVEKSLTTPDELPAGIKYSDVNFYEVYFLGNLNCHGANGLWGGSDTTIRLHPFYTRNNIHEGTVVYAKFDNNTGKYYGYGSYRDIDYTIREYDWESVIKMFPEYTFTNDEDVYIDGIYIENFSKITAEWSVAVTYKISSSEIVDARTLIGVFTFSYDVENGINSIRRQIITDTNSRCLDDKKEKVSFDLNSALHKHGETLDICEKLMDKYIKQQEWGKYVKL